MKKLVSTIIAVLCCIYVSAQTLNIQMGEVIYQVPAAQLINDYKDMVYVDGSYRRDWYRAFRQFKSKGTPEDYGYFGFGANGIISNMVKLPS